MGIFRRHQILMILALFVWCAAVPAACFALVRVIYIDDFNSTRYLWVDALSLPAGGSTADVFYATSDEEFSSSSAIVAVSLKNRKRSLVSAGPFSAAITESECTLSCTPRYFKPGVIQTRSATIPVDRVFVTTAVQVIGGVTPAPDYVGRISEHELADFSATGTLNKSIRAVELSPTLSAAFVFTCAFGSMFTILLITRTR